MGEIADMMLDGTLDAITGEYIDGESPGYPRTIDGSLDWERGAHGGSGYYGVVKWILSKPRKFPKPDEFSSHDKIIKAFGAHKQFDTQKPGKIANRISKEFWQEFVSFVNHNY